MAQQLWRSNPNKQTLRKKASIGKPARDTLKYDFSITATPFMGSLKLVIDSFLLPEKRQGACETFLANTQEVQDQASPRRSGSW